MKHFFSCLSVCLSEDGDEDDDEGETAKIEEDTQLD
jgi:hypothetical protein